VLPAFYLYLASDHSRHRTPAASPVGDEHERLPPPAPQHG